MRHWAEVDYRSSRPGKGPIVGIGPGEPPNGLEVDGSGWVIDWLAGCFRVDEGWRRLGSD
jgi:hypothetical protein